MFTYKDLEIEASQGETGKDGHTARNIECNMVGVPYLETYTDIPVLQQPSPLVCRP